MPDENETRNLAAAQRYLEALERFDEDSLTPLLAPDIVQEEFPNRLKPHGARAGREVMLQAVQRGKQLLRCQHFEVHNALAVGEQVALEATWTGTLAVALGDLSAGSALRARFAVFLRFRDGLIVQQRNYDCFDPW